jgi:photosystem II stability/assembly factor-like uncharacterized protein
MTILLSALVAFTQLSVIRPADGAGVSVAPVTDGATPPADRTRPRLDAEGGFTWNLQATFPNVVFIDLSFADDSVGYACAELGVVYKTTNSGATWSRIMNLGFPYYWYGVSALSRDRAIVSGFNNTEGTGIYRWTDNGGSTWDSIIMLDTANWLSRAHFADSLHGIIAAGWNGGIWRTENGGRNPYDWTYVQVDPARGWFEGNFCYRADGHCWLTGINFCGSADNGATWNVQHSADATFDGGVWFSDTLHGWTGGGQISSPVSGWVHRTTDGGAIWSDRLIETPAPVRAVLFLNDTLGFAVGGNIYSSAGFIYSTVNGGDSWRLDVNTSYEMKGIDYQAVGDSIDLWCCGFNSSFTGCIYKTRVPATGTGISEWGVANGSPDKPASAGPTILTEASSIKRLASSLVFDATGRRVLDPKPGVYFVRQGPQAASLTPRDVRRVVIVK